MKAIADTGLLLAFLNRTDRFHRWALEAIRDVEEPLLTCEAVLAETAFRAESSALVLGLLTRGMLRVAFNVEENVDHLITLAHRYQDCRPDFADLCLIRMSELHPHHTIITIDENDFRVYRRNKRDTIPLLCPPRRQ